MRRIVILIPFLLLAQSRSMWEGVSTKAQIAKGQKVYREECQRCHGENMLGGEDTPELVGDSFLERWTGKTVGDLFERTRKTMPTDGPGNLGRQQYADVTAYILSSNKVPAGQKDLETDAAPLQQIRIEAKQ